MGRALLIVSIVSILGLVVAMGIAIEVSVHGAFISPDGHERFTGAIVAESANNLAFATGLYGTLTAGVLGLILAARRHQGGWFVAILLALPLGIVGLGYRYLHYPYVLLFPQELVFDALPLLACIVVLIYGIAILRNSARLRMTGSRNVGDGP